MAAQREGNRILADALKPLDLSPSSAEVLRVISDHGPLSPADLGELLVCENGSPSRLAMRMVEAGLLQRRSDRDDGRRIILTLTSKGREREAKVRAVEQELHELIAVTLQGLDAAEAREAVTIRQGS